MLPSYVTNIGRLNVLTQYPEILTFHTLVDKKATSNHYNSVGPWTLTEKINGLNTRLILLPTDDGKQWEGVFIGGRDQLFWWSKDVLANHHLGEVNLLKSTALRLLGLPPKDSGVIVFYGEFYGGKHMIGGREYGSLPAFRLFDIAAYKDYRVLLTKTPVEIKVWKEFNEPVWCNEEELKLAAQVYNLLLVPFLGEVAQVPTQVEKVLPWLESLLPATQCPIDSSALGKAEGIILRTKDRRRIYKMRKVDYGRV